MILKVIAEQQEGVITAILFAFINISLLKYWHLDV